MLPETLLQQALVKNALSRRLTWRESYVFEDLTDATEASEMLSPRLSSLFQQV